MRELYLNPNTNWNQVTCLLLSSPITTRPHPSEGLYKFNQKSNTIGFSLCNSLFENTTSGYF